MQMNGNTILITGGGSGIGRALAEAFHAAGNRVIIAGRRPEMLEAVASANPGMKFAVLDIEKADAIQSFAQRVMGEHPTLDTVIHNAGIMRLENLKEGGLDTAEATIATNLLGPIRLNAALLPTLLSRPRATILTVSSGLAFVPRATTPTYSATKAAIHSYTESLRAQLAGTAVQVIELIPPYVQTELMSPDQAKDPNAMPLKTFIAETLEILKASPEVNEVCVERVKPLRFAEATGNYGSMFKRLNGIA